MTTAQLKSLEDLRRYSLELAARRVDDDSAVQKLQFTKQAVWLFLLTCTFLCYYLLDKMGEALALI